MRKYQKNKKEEQTQKFLLSQGYSYNDTFEIMEVLFGRAKWILFDKRTTFEGTQKIYNG